jgi:hypothetical protein
MGAQRTTPPVDQRIATLAARQFGVVGREQLAELGVARGSIRKRLAARRLYRIHVGVYSIVHPRLLTRTGWFKAALLACGEGAVLSHRSAAIWWGMLRGPARPVHVTAPTQRGRKQEGIVLHRSLLRDDEVTVHDGLPVTSPARTLIDLADLGRRRDLERAMDEADYLRLDCTGLAPRPGRRGSGLLAAVLAEHRAGSTRTRSDFEELMLGACDAQGLPRPECNAYVGPWEVDCLWRRERLAVEMDSFRAHTTRKAFERDRLKDADLLEAGYRVVRITYRRLEREPQAVAAQLRRLLAAAPAAAPGGSARP